MTNPDLSALATELVDRWFARRPSLYPRYTMKKEAVPILQRAFAEGRVEGLRESERLATKMQEVAWPRVWPRLCIAGEIASAIRVLIERESSRDKPIA